jgi:hypothetical protein
MIERRGFLKVATMMVGSVLVAKYIEPAIELIKPEKHTWIEDKGDFYIVRVPEYKTFAKEILDKPTIFLMDHHSTVTQVDVKGYSNIKMSGYCTVTESRFDVSEMITEQERSVLLVNGTGTTNQIHYSHFICSGKSSAVQYNFDRIKPWDITT